MGLFRRRKPSGPPQGAPTYLNSAVIERIARDEGIPHATAVSWFKEMLVFLDMCAASDVMLSPSKQVDAAWHAFLLHTRDYEAYCRERFGRIIHHDPSGKPDPVAYRRAYEEAAARSDTGLDPAIWPVPVGLAGAAGIAEASGGEEERKDDGSARCGGTGAGCGGSADGGHDVSETGSGFDVGGSTTSSCSGGWSCSSGSSCGGSSCGGGGCGGGG